MQTDEQLMLEFQRGAREAFGELFARYRQPVWGFFRRRVATAARAEELAQETFLAVLRGRERWEPRAAFRSYLYGVAFRILSAERRKNSHPPEAADSVGASTGGDNEAAMAVRQALEQLDADDREVLLLREYEGLRYDEIAEVLGVPVGTVRSRLFRARMALRDLLSPHVGAYSQTPLPDISSAKAGVPAPPKERPRGGRTEP